MLKEFLLSDELLLGCENTFPGITKFLMTSHSVSRQSIDLTAYAESILGCLFTVMHLSTCF